MILKHGSAGTLMRQKLQRDCARTGFIRTMDGKSIARKFCFIEIAAEIYFFRYAVLIRMTGSQFHWILLDSLGFHWISLDFIGFHWIPLELSGFRWISLDFIS